MTSSLNSNFGRQGDTATIVLVDDYNTPVTGFNSSPGQPHFAIPAYSTIQLVDEGVGSPQGIMFTGLVTNPQWMWTAPGRVEWLLQCTDLTVYADTSIVQEVYSGINGDDIIVDVTTKAECGITAAKVSDGGHVYPAPLVPLAYLSYGQLSKHWTDVAKLSSQGMIYGWTVDENAELWFYPQTLNIPSGVTVTDTPTSSTPSMTECHIDPSQQMLYEFDGTTFYTRVVVEGALVTVSYDAGKARKGQISPTDAYVGNGYSQSWPLSYTPEVTSLTLKAAAGIVSEIGSTTQRGAAYLTVGGVVENVSINDGTTTITTPFQLIQSSNGLWSLQVTPGVGSTPPAGTPIKIWYRYQNPIIAQADNVSQQQRIGGPNGGVFSEFVKDTSLTTVAAAFSRAKADLSEFGAPHARITFYTSPDFLGWIRTGQTFILQASQIPDSQNAWNLGLTGVFFVIQQMTNFVQGGYRSTQVTAVRIE